MTFDVTRQRPLDCHHQYFRDFPTTNSPNIPYAGRKAAAVFTRAVHPGLILKDELAELDITPTDFARQIDVPPNRISQIISGKRSVTGDTALRFGHWFDVDPQFWLNLQAQFDLALAAQKSGAAVKELPTAAGSRR